MYNEAIFTLIPITIAILGGLLTWYLTEKSKRKYEEYKRKEERYSLLIKYFKGFYIESESKELKTEFLNQINLCWLYCPDTVIHKAYNFLKTVHTDQTYSDEEKENAAGEFIVSIRNDLISRKILKKSELTSKDFKHLRAT